jgi:hypothetical protein
MRNFFSVKMDGKEVEDPVVRSGLLMAAVVIFAIAIMAIPVILMGAVGIIMGVLILFPIMIIPHFILRMRGRRGFFKMARDEFGRTVFEMKLSREAFKKK